MPQKERVAYGLHSSRCLGRLGGLAVEHLPLAQGMIPGSWDRVLHQAPLPVALMNK